MSLSIYQKVKSHSTTDMNLDPTFFDYNGGRFEGDQRSRLGLGATGRGRGVPGDRGGGGSTAMLQWDCRGLCMQCIVRAGVEDMT